MTDFLFVYLAFISPILFYSGFASSEFILGVLGILTVLAFIEEKDKTTKTEANKKQ